jgi:eukaryotic-like serine/threonine-protein kinase
MPLAAGAHLGPYKILSLIGEGGMGEVWKARDTRLDRIVAIKRLKREHGARFQQEARAVAALNHPHICQIYDIGPDYLVLEYIEGHPVKGPLAHPEALRVALQIAAALEAAHAKDILHRDLKPGNILMTASGAKLLDFGLAKLTADGDATQTIGVSGTPLYMSPEQAEGKPLDARSDVFSFGAVLYELLAGKRAFDSLGAVLRDELAPINTAPDLGRIIMRCLRKAPADRFQSFPELKVALEQCGMKPGEQQPSIAVLPFANMSGDKEQEYFSDGLSEEIINALTKVPNLKVTARTSAFSFRGKDVDIGEIARKLGVEHILEGSVRKSGNRIRIAAQLIKATDGFHVWSERYDRELTDIFAIQDDISAAIANQLKVNLGGHLPAAKRPVNIAAYEALLEGRHHWLQLTPDAFAKAFVCFERAIAIDPEYAPAHVGMCQYYMGLAWFGGADGRECFSKIGDSARRALALDPELADAHSALGHFDALLEYDWAASERHFLRSLRLDPASPSCRLPYAVWCLRPQGRLKEAVAELDAALRLDPLNTNARVEKAHVLNLMRKYGAAEESARRALDIDPNYLLGLFQLADARRMQGRLEEAIAIAERAAALHGRWFVTLAYLAIGHADAGHTEEVRRLLAEMHQLGGRIHVNASAMAGVYVAQGDLDSGAEWVDRAIEQREPIITTLKYWPIFDRLRSHPRYPALLRKMNLA